MIIEYKNLMLDVSYSYSPGCRGEYDGPFQISPDDPEEVEIDQVLHEGYCMEEWITPEYRKEIAERILDQIKEDEREARIQAEIDKVFP